MLKKYRIYIILILLVFVLAGGYYWQVVQKTVSPSKQEADQTNVSDTFFKPILTPETERTADEPQTQNLPASFVIANFPFQSQAPLTNWDELHDEACEEASVILIRYYLAGQNISAEEMDLEILKMVGWEVKNWGEHRDINTTETKEMAGRRPAFRKSQLPHSWSRLPYGRSHRL